MRNYSIVYVFIGLLVGFINSFLYMNGQDKVEDLSGTCGKIRGKVASVISYKGSLQQFDLSNVHIDTSGNIHYLNENVRVSVSLFPILRLGDELEINACLEKSEYLQYQSSLEQRGVGYVTIASTHTILKPVNLSVVNEIKNYCVESIESNFSEPYASILMGFSWGIKRIRGGFWDEKVKQSGLSYLFSISGYHIFIISDFLNKIAIKLVKRSIAILLILYSLFIYGIISESGLGFSRAFLMIFLMFLGQIFGRPVLREITVIVAVALLLVGNPAVYRLSGFQLSIAATIGIIILSPVMKNWTQKISKFLSVWFVTPFIAQLVTFPIIAYSYGGIATLSVLPGIIISIVFPYIVISGLLIPIIARVSIAIDIVKIIISPFLFFVDWIFDVIYKIPFAFCNIKVSQPFVYIYYILIVLFYLIFNNE